MELRDVLITHENHWRRAFERNTMTSFHTDSGIIRLDGEAVMFQGAKCKFEFKDLIEVKRIPTPGNRFSWERARQVSPPFLVGCFLLTKSVKALHLWPIWAALATPFFAYSLFYLIRSELLRTPWVVLSFYTPDRRESSVYLIRNEPIFKLMSAKKTEELYAELNAIIGTNKTH